MNECLTTHQRENYIGYWVSLGYWASNRGLNERTNKHFYDILRYEIVKNWKQDHLPIPELHS